MSRFRIALIQLAVSANKTENLQKVTKFVKEAAEKGAKLVALPECFNSPYGVQYFSQNSETIPDGETCKTLSDCAKDNNVVLIGGSIPEKSSESNEQKIYNTCTVWGPKGNLLATHRKVHLFDINIPNKITFQESKVLSPGSQLTSVTTDLCKIGIGICYDLRFAEMAQIYRDQGCHLIVYPGAFNMTTGPAHWQILQQGRALDNQLYVASISPARDTSASYIAWGHSMIVNPFGEILIEADEKENILYSDIDLEFMKNTRENIPLEKQRRLDLYSTINKSNN